MAESFNDAVRHLRSEPSIAFPSNEYAQRIVVEVDTVPKEHIRKCVKVTPGSPDTVDLGVIPKYRRGAAHPQCPFMILLDLNVLGGDDTDWNIQLIYGIDIEALFNATPDDPFWGDPASPYNPLLNDAFSTRFPYFDDSEHRTVTFEVLNPDTYQRAPQMTPHPDNPNLLLHTEYWTRKNQRLTVVREYHEIAPLSEQGQFMYVVEYEDPGDGVDPDTSYPLLTIFYDTYEKDFVPSSCEDLVPVPWDTSDPNGDKSSWLQFRTLGLKQIEPPRYDPINDWYGRVTVRYGKLPGWVKTKITKCDRSAQGADTITTVQRVAASSPVPEKGIKDLVVEQENINACSSLLTKKSLIGDWPVFTDTAEDPETGTKITIKKEIVDPASAVPAASARKVITRQQIDCAKALQVTRELDEVPDPRIEYTPLRFTYPRLLLNLVVALHKNQAGRNYGWWHADVREAYARNVRAIVEYSYHETEVEPPESYVYIPEDIRFSGLILRIGINGVLHDGHTIWELIGTDDTYWEPNSLQVTYPETNPTASEWIAMENNGDEIVISSGLTKWKYNMWRQRVLRVKLQPPPT